MPSRHCLVVEAESRHRAGSKVLDEHIGVLEQTPQDGLSLVTLEVEGAATFAPVHREVIRRLTTEKRRTKSARFVAPCGFLDLDDVGAHVAKTLSAEGSRHDTAEVDDTDPVEGTRGWHRRIRHDPDQVSRCASGEAEPRSNAPWHPPARSI